MCYVLSFDLQCFDAVGWAPGRALVCRIECWGACVVVCLGQHANDLQIVKLMTSFGVLLKSSEVDLIFLMSHLMLLVGQREGHPSSKQNWVVGCWHGCLSGARCRACIWSSWNHCYPLSLVSVKYRLVVPFWYQLTQVVPDKGPLNVCVCVCVRACVWCWRKTLP